MNTLILTPKKSKSLKEFVAFWKQFYDYRNESNYQKHINKKEFSAANVLELYIWKNSMPLSNKKKDSIQQKIIANLNLINQYKKIKKIDTNEFRDNFKTVKAVWHIFLLHIIKPNKFPIYDQNIHRAFNYLNNKDWKSINNKISDSAKLDFYFNTYLHFVEKSKFHDLKALDEAFFAFGQFLNTRRHYEFFN